MTVAADSGRIKHNCNGILTAFAFTFNISATSEVKVIKADSDGTETILTENVNYTVTATNNDFSNGGTVTTVSGTALTPTALPSSYTLTILLNPAINQESDFTEGMGALVETIETELDHRARVEIMLQEQLRRCFSFSASSGILASDYPFPTPQADYVIGWNSLGTRLINREPGTVLPDVSGKLDTVANIAELKAIVPSAEVNFVQPLGYYEEGDGGGGPVRRGVYGAAPGTYTASANDATIILPSGGDGSTAWLAPEDMDGEGTAREWGCKGDGATDDYTRLQAAIDFYVLKQGKLLLGKGNFRYTTALNIDYANITIEGVGFGPGGSVLRPVDCVALIMDGSVVTGGFCFNVFLRNFRIDNTNVTVPMDYSVLLKDFYRCGIDDVFIVNSNIDNTTGFTKVVDIAGSVNASPIDGIIVIGSNDTHPTGYGIHVENTSGVVVLNNADVENCARGIMIEANARVNLLQPYTERTGTGIWIEDGVSPTQTPHINITGGVCSLGSSTASGLIISGNFADRETINIDGLKFTSEDHATKNNGINLGALNWLNVNKIRIANIDWSWIDPPPANTQTWLDISPFTPEPAKLLATALYDFDDQGGAVGNRILSYLPDNATIARSWYEVLTPPTSGGLATIGIGIVTNDVNGIVAATAYSDGVFAAGYHEAIQDGAVANFTVKTTAKRAVVMEIAVADLTAGKIRIWYEYIVSE